MRVHFRKRSSITWLGAAFAVLALCGATAQAQPFIVGNSGAFGNGPIVTYNFATGATVNSFVPTGAQTGLNNGRGVLARIVANRIYYTELEGVTGFDPTPVIHVAPYNGGAGGADITTWPTPRPGVGIQDIAYHNGLVYVLTGDPFSSPQLFLLNPTTGAKIFGPVNIAAPASGDSDGMAVLTNGNVLINRSLGSCTYDQYSWTTGAQVIGTITVPKSTYCTGADFDGTNLYFMTDGVNITQTTTAGVLVVQRTVALNSVKDISIAFNF